MGKILQFPKKTKIAPLTVRKGRKHRISVTIVDEVRPRRTRWIVQFEIQEAAGYDANTGFTDEAVTAGYRHGFYVTTTQAVRQFVAETSHLVASGEIAVWIDGVRVRQAVALQA
jgi:hypothetical protein